MAFAIQRPFADNLPFVVDGTGFFQDPIGTGWDHRVQVQHSPFLPEESAKV